MYVTTRSSDSLQGNGEPQCYNCKELNLANNMNKFGCRFFPRVSGKEHSPTDASTSALEDPEERTQPGESR